MADLARKPIRFNFLGVALSAPVDEPSLTGSGKMVIGENIRAYSLNPIETRAGLTKLSTLGSGPVHSIIRLSDPLNATFTRIAGSGTVLGYGTAAALTQADTGYSGNPLSMIPYQPDLSPDSWLYVGDSSKMAKIKADGTTRAIGIAPPTSEPTASLGANATLDVDMFQATTNWAADNTVLDNAGLSIIARINTSVTASIGDVAGGGAGWYTIQPAAITDILPGTFVTFGTTGGSSKFVQAVRAPSFTTTVAAITYDSGTTGPCSIQPTAPVYLDSDCMVQLNAAEYVRVISVNDAPDGTVQSFRCSTVGTVAAAQSITGISSFRAYCDAAPTGTITHSAMRVAFKSTGGGIGYITKSAGLANSNLSVISSRQLTPDDEIACAIRMSNLTELVEGKLYVNVDSSDLTGVQNAYLWTFRPSDLQKIIADQQTVLAAQSTQLANQATSSVVFDSSTNTAQELRNNENAGFAIQPDTSFDPTDANIGAGGAISSVGSLPQAFFPVVGNAQWVQMRFKISDATRIGTAVGRTLGTVTAIRISLNCTTTLNTDTVDFDAWWVGGTYGPDVGDIGNGYVYRTRGRDSRTGARSNPGPPMRIGGAIYPHRQAVSVAFPSLTTATDASWSQCNYCDVFRFGGSINDWRYLGSIVNDPATAATLTFSDIYPDDFASVQPVLEENVDQPFTIIDKPRTGTCNVSGTTVTRVSGDLFNLQWAAGNSIIIGVGNSAVTYHFHNRPSTTSKVELEESGGTQAAVTWTIAAPTLIGQSLPAIWGPLDNFMLACGDNVNPGRLYWTNGNNPDGMASDNYIDVTPPSEPLQNGCMFDGRAFVWSTDRMFAIYPTFEGAILTGTQILGGTTQLLSPFRALEIPNSKGLYARWAFCVGQRIWDLGRDGIYSTTGGEPQSITDAELYAWFPHDGQPGQTLNGFAAPDLTYTNALTRPKDFRLAEYDDYLYFDYRATDGTLHTAIYDSVRKAWQLDAYGRTVVMHYGERGTKDGFSTYVGGAIHDLLLGGTDGSGNGTIFQNIGTDDDTVAIACHVRTPSWDADEPWADKQWEDIMLDLAPNSVAVTVTPGVNNYGTLAAATVLAGTTRAQQIVAAANVLGRNMALDITWTGSGPQLYIWEPAFLPHSFIQNSWATVVQSHGKSGWQHVREAYIAYVSTSASTFIIVIDGVTYTYVLPNSSGAQIKYYLPLQAVKGKGFQYKVAGTAIRLIPADCELHLKEWSAAGPYTIMPIPFSTAERV